VVAMISNNKVSMAIKLFSQVLKKTDAAITFVIFDDKL
jgi:hypothetical protein